MRPSRAYQGLTGEDIGDDSPFRDYGRSCDQEIVHADAGFHGIGEGGRYA
jgi:hypothetical protein